MGYAILIFSKNKVVNLYRVKSAIKSTVGVLLEDFEIWHTQYSAECHVLHTNTF